MPSNKHTPRHVDPEDISGRMFRQALLDAHERVGRNTSELERAIGAKVGCCKYWIGGGTPPYRKMQDLYFKFLDVKAEV